MKTCPSCGEENPERFRLCGYCGTPLPEVAAPKREIRKTVSIVFCDLKGSTAMAERLDGESLREVLTLYFSEMRACLERHGGVVEKYIGDAIMAVFGLPESHEDDALRAVRAAADMRDALAAVNERLEAGWGVRLTNRTGVNTGEVVTAADADSREHLVAGDAVNVAARLEQAAPVNEILIGETTFRLVRNAIQAEAVEPLELKGKSGRVPAHRLLAVSKADGVARRADAPIVGRTAELEELDRLLDRAVATRTCQLVTVVAPAGTGKSRLLAEFVRRSSHRTDALHGRCLSYGEGITFWPLAEITREAASIAEEDSLDEAQTKLAAVVDDDAAARLSAAIGLSDESFAVNETFWAARRLLESQARRRPLIVVIEDIHWAEQTFLDLLGYLVDTLADAPVVLVCSARRDLLEDHPGWPLVRAGVTTILLQPLSEADSAAVVSNLLGSAALEQDVRDRIVAAADGNPLFVEQLLAMLIDDGLLVRTPDGGWKAPSTLGRIEMPGSIAALLVARLDRLPAEERAVLECGAVMGQVFFQAAVEELRPERVKGLVRTSLESLRQKELIVPNESLFEGEPAFRFSHILIRDCAYSGVLKRTRTDLHEQFVDWLERVGHDRVAEYDEIRGYHLEQAYLTLMQLGPADDHVREVGRRGARYLSPAGRRALARGDLPAASSLLRRAASLLPEDDAERPDLLLQAGEALLELGEFTVADSVLQAAESEARTRGDEGLALTAALALVHLHYVTEGAGGEAGVIDEVRRAIDRLDDLGDERGLARAWRLLVYVFGTACRWGAAEIAARQAMSHADVAGEHRLGAGFVASLATCALYGPTPVPEAIRICEDLFRRAGEDRKAEALVLRSMAMLEAMRGSFDRARELYARSRAELHELGWKVLAALTSLVSGPIEMLAGDPAAAERELRGDYAALESMGERNYISTTAGFLAEALYQQGKVEEAEAFALTCRELAAADDLSSQVLWRGVLAKVLSETGRISEAVGLARRAVELMASADEPDTRGVALLDLAEVLMTAGKERQAFEAATDAAAAFGAKGNVVSAVRAATMLKRVRTTAPA